MVKPTRVEYITPGVWEDDEPRRVSYADQERQGLVRRNGPAFVEPGSRPLTPTRVEVLPAAEMPAAAAPTATVQNVTTGGHLDRAQGFAHVTSRLALATGAIGVLVAIVGQGAPLISLAVLAWFGSLYTATWLIAYTLHIFVSAEGAAWWHVIQGWRWLRREQRHRHQLERHANGLGRKARQ